MNVAELGQKYRNLRNASKNRAELELLNHLLRDIESLAAPVGQVVASGFFYYDGDNFETVDSLEKAREQANESLDIFREDAADGWPDGSDRICYGVIVGESVEVERRESTPDDVCHPDCQIFVDYQVRETCPYRPAAAEVTDGLIARTAWQQLETQNAVMNDLENALELANAKLTIWEESVLSCQKVSPRMVKNVTDMIARKTAALTAALRRE